MLGSAVRLRPLLPDFEKGHDADRGPFFVLPLQQLIADKAPDESVGQAFGAGQGAICSRTRNGRGVSERNRSMIGLRGTRYSSIIGAFVSGCGDFTASTNPSPILDYAVESLSCYRIFKQA